MSWDKCVQKEMRVQEGRKQKGICGKEGIDPVVRTVKWRSGGLEVQHIETFEVFRCFKLNLNAETELN